MAVKICRKRMHFTQINRATAFMGHIAFVATHRESLEPSSLNENQLEERSNDVSTSWSHNCRRFLLFRFRSSRSVDIEIVHSTNHSNVNWKCFLHSHRPASVSIQIQTSVNLIIVRSIETMIAQKDDFVKGIQSKREIHVIPRAIHSFSCPILTQTRGRQTPDIASSQRGHEHHRSKSVIASNVRSLSQRREQFEMKTVLWLCVA